MTAKPLFRRAYLVLFPLLLFGISAKVAANGELRVVVEPVLAQPLPGKIHVSGNVVSRQQVDLATEIEGQVSNVLVEAGDSVEQGQILVQLRNKPGRWRLAEAEARLKSSKAELQLRKLEQQRLENLLDRKSVSQDAYDQAIARTLQAEAGVETQMATVELLRDELARHDIKAPFSGIVARKLVEQGDWVSEGDAVANLATVEILRLELAVPQKYFGSITLDSEAEINIGTETITVPVERIVPFADQSRNFLVWVSLDDHAKHWIPGMSASAIIRWQPDINFPWLVSADALIRQPDDTIQVWKISSSGESITAAPVLVRAGYQSGNRVAIASSELRSGDLVVVKGNEALQPGQSVILAN